MVHHDHPLLDCLVGYASSGLVFFSGLPWAGIGASVLLVARLIQDVPKAIEVIRGFRNKRKKREKRK